jgi:pimeloyl-ACP methyl ester carboxylesterase
MASTTAPSPDTTAAPSTTADPGTSSTSTTGDAGGGAGGGTPRPAGDIAWSPIDDRIDEARVEVPLDHDDPDGEQIELYLVRHQADPGRRVGVLFVNPGGPGYGGSFLAQQAEFIYGPDLLAAFDIIGFDPRGTGLSEPHVDCVDDYDPFFGIETGPDDAAEDEQLRNVAGFFAQSCINRSGELLPHVGTVAAAGDIDAVRRALGEEQVSYFGWSYGTQLGATWATLFPDTVRAAVLDGAVDPTVGRIDGLVQQSAGFEASLATFLADCSGDTTCAFHNDGDAEAAFDDLLAQLEATDIPTRPDRPTLTQGVFELAVAQALYSDVSWPELAQALADAAGGDGSGLLALYDAYYGRLPDGGYADDLEAYFAITCADDPSAGGPDGIAEAVDRRADFAVSSPRIGTSAAYEVLICASFPAGALGDGDPGFRITGAGAGPIVVVGNTGDPATPFEGSRRMAESLEEGVFVAVEADQHTAYGLNGCIDGAIDRYLVDLDVPAADLSC